MISTRVVLVVSLMIPVVLIGCGSYQSTVSRASSEDLAAMHDAMKDRKVLFYLRDSVSGAMYTEVATDLLVDVHTASWTDATGTMRTIRSEQIVKIVCADCSTSSGSGFLIGTLSGSLVGLLAGAGSEVNENLARTWRGEPRQSSKAPVYAVLGGLFGGLLGGAIGSSSTREAVWLLEPQSSSSPSVSRSGM